MNLLELLRLGDDLSGKRDPRLLQGMALAVGEALAATAPYLLTYVLLDDLFAGQLSLQRTGWLVAGIALALAVQIGFGIPSVSRIYGAAYGQMGEARIRLADHLRRLPMGFFSRRRGGQLAGVLTSDMALIEDIWCHFIGLFTVSAALPLFMGLALVAIDWRMGLAIFLTLPLAVVVLLGAMRRMDRETRALVQASDHAKNASAEYVQGIAVLRSFGRQGEGLERLRLALAQLRDAAIRMETGPAPLIHAFSFITEAGFVCVLLIGSYLLSGGTLGAPAFLMFALLAITMTRRLSDLGITLWLLRFAHKGLPRVRNLLAQAPLAEPAQAEAPTHFEIRLDGVSLAYDSAADARHALHDVSCTLPERSLTAIVGPSGAGKTSLMNVIARLWEVSEGSVRIGGIDVRAMPFEDLHRHVAMVFQDVVLFSGTVADNLRVGRPDADMQALMAAAQQARAHDFIMALPQGYDTPLGEGGARLSGGERQRIAFARAILKDAPIVLLDEATASLDATHERELQQAIDRLTRDKTVVVIAHRLRTVRHADQLLVLEGGRLVEQGRHEVLLAAGGTYARLWRRQSEVRGWKLAGQDQAKGEAAPSTTTATR
ncbi:ABC transporter ATP-binding protein [Delftia deserti]|uniref:ABC transporter ATP-binding protein n=1 Tax=Delftia deserti TaxID=1651218 RepID=A0ABW5EHW8_9BURK